MMKMNKKEIKKINQKNKKIKLMDNLNNNKK